MRLYFLALLVTIGSAVASAQQRPEFEVASIRPSNPDESFINARTPSLQADAARNLVFRQTSIVNMIMLAYNVGAPQIIGPDWLSIKELSRADHFDVIARIPEGSTPAQVPAMLQSLLADRFHLKFHQETKVLGSYALMVGKNGLKLKETPGDGPQGNGVCNRSFAQRPGATLAAECRGIAGADIAQQIQTLAPGYFRDGPIVDMTNLKGVYDFSLEWITVQQAEAGIDGPSMFAAVEQLGLKIESRKQSLPVLVIEQVDRMQTEN
jgi:uncharacterized protein (TIGR03435 family)